MIPINNNKEPTKSFTDAIFTKKILLQIWLQPPFSPFLHQNPKVHEFHKFGRDFLTHHYHVLGGHFASDIDDLQWLVMSFCT